MPYKGTVDENLTFLYECQKACPGKIDFSIVAASTGVSLNAARKRYARLKDKLDVGVASPTPPLPTNRDISTPSSFRIPKATVPQKRRISTVDSKKGTKTTTRKTSDSKANFDIAPPRDGIVTNRRTRGKKINYDLSAIDDSDGEMEQAYCSGFDSDGEFEEVDADTEVQSDSDLSLEPEDEITPSSKRLKKELQSATSTSQVAHALMSLKNDDLLETVSASSRFAISKKKSPLAKPMLLSEKALAHLDRLQADQPMPSIETSPPHSDVSAPQEKSETGEEDIDIDIKSLRPGTILSFGPTSASSRYITPPVKGTYAQAQPVFSGIAESMSATRFENSAVDILEVELKAHARDVCPEDSVLIANEQNPVEYSSPRTPLGKKTTFQLLKGLWSPWKAT